MIGMKQSNSGPRKFIIHKSDLMKLNLYLK